MTYGSSSLAGWPARLHGTGHTTVDVDICPASDEANVANLAAAPRELGVRLRVEGDPEGVPFAPDPALLAQVETMTLLTELGPLDLCFAPAGFPGGYEGRRTHASIVDVAAIELPVASLEDVVASKRAAGRPKDIVALPALEAHLRRRRP